MNMSGLYASADERRWNRMSDRMNSFHQWFRQVLDVVYELSDGSFNKRGLSLKNYLSMMSELITHLNFHHQIEERHIFPILAQRMPEFADGARHIASHQSIHHGLDALSALVSKYTREPSTYSPAEVQACLDSFKKVLFDHLDEEVQDLKPVNLKQYYSLEEVDRLPM